MGTDQMTEASIEDERFLRKLNKSIKAVSDDTILPLPGIHRKTTENIGAFIIAWGILERELDNAFHVLFHTDATLAVCLYANLGTKAKVDTLQSAITMQAVPLGKSLVKATHQILRQIGELSDTARNTIAHGQLKYFRDEETGKYTWELVRHNARKSAAIIIHPGNFRFWLSQKKRALALAQRWRRSVQRMHNKLVRLNMADLEKICLAQLRESEPSRLHRRKRPPPKKANSRDRQTKLAKWPRT